MKLGSLVGIVVVISFVVFIVVNLAIWLYISRKQYVRRIKPGDEYQIGNRSYKLPDLPLRGEAWLLDERYLIKQRNLLRTVTILLNENNIEAWISGGTLLGFTRHGTFIPWDDDIDFHTHWKNREYLYSSEFGQQMAQNGLEVIFLVGSSLSFSTKEAAAVRIRTKNTFVPVCDIFFVKEMTPGVFAKVDNWNGKSIKYSTKERWDKHMLFPTVVKEIDGLHLVFPNKPENVLKQQYGSSVLDTMYARNILFSHLYPFNVTRWVWKTRT